MAGGGAVVSNSLKWSPSLVMFIVCRNRSASCPPQAPPSASSFGCAGCSGNWPSPAAPSNVTGYRCCPGNMHPPITACGGRRCCSGGGSKPVVPSVGKVGKSKKLLSREEKNKFYLQQSCAEYARRGGKLIGLPVSGLIFSPSRHSWRISWLAVESASKKHHKKGCSNNHLPTFIYWNTKSIEGDTK